jgi:plasmid stability protein
MLYRWEGYAERRAMTLTLELNGNKEAALEARARAHGVSAEQFVQQILERELERKENPAANPARRRISERIAETMADVPPEVARVPRDGARQVDHYVYGLPMRD